MAAFAPNKLFRSLASRAEWLLFDRPTKHRPLEADGHLGYIEVGEINQSLTRSNASLTWTDVGNVSATAPNSLDSILPTLMSAAAEWLLLGGIERIIDYYAEDVDPPEYLTALQRIGFRRLSTNERGWTLRP